MIKEVLIAMRFVNRFGFVLLALMASVLALCSTSLGDVLINEVEINPPDNDSIWIELHNTGNETVDISGWKIEVISSPWVGPILIQQGKEIQANGYYVAEGDSRWAASDNATVNLTDSQGNRMDKTPELSDTNHNDFTWSRLPGHWDRDARKGDWAWTLATKGKPNVGSMIG
jgi:hypothetical protein